MPLHTDRALVLSRHAFGESSLVVHVLTPGSGRVNLLAKGAYRTTSRYFAVLDRFDTLELEWSAAPRQELATLRRGDVLVRRARIAEDLGAYRAAASLLELLDLVVRPAAAEHELFARSERALDALARAPAAAERILVAWELELLEQLGLTPALDVCGACGSAAPPLREAPDRAAFSAGAGGRLCEACAREARASGRRVGTLPVSVLDDARRLWQDPELAAELDAARVERVRDFVERFLDYHLETRPKSHRTFLAVPNRNAPTPAP
jgi:DNA repair protein RecO (recombination protein O)